MNFWQRFGLFWNYLWRGEKALALMTPTWTDGQPTYLEASFENLVRHGWRKNELIFACVSKTAATASFVHLSVKRKRDDEELLDHPLRQLIRRPNPFMDEFDFWYSVVVYQKLAGGAYFEKERDRAGRVVRLWPLRPDWVRPVRSSAAFIAGYEYEVPGNAPIALRAEDVLDFKLFDPLNLYRGYPPAAVAGRVGDVDNATTDYLKLFMEKGGMPPGLLKTKQKLVDQDVADIRRRWSERYGGALHWLEPAVLDQDAEYQTVGLSFKDMGFDMLDARSEARICAVLDVPPIIVGAKIGLDRATYSNYGEARLAWWEDSLIPQYRNFESVVTNDLAAEFGGDIYTAFDMGEVPALKEAEESKWARANEGLARGYLTVNEAREIVGLDDVGPNGEIFLRSMASVEVPVKGARPQPQPQPDPAADPEDDPEDEDAADTEAAARILAMEAKAQGATAPDEDERRRFEALLQARLDDYLPDALERMTAAVGERYQPVTMKAHRNGSAPG